MESNKQPQSSAVELMQPKKQGDSLAATPLTPAASVTTSSVSVATLATISSGKASAMPSHTPAAASLKTAKPSPTSAAKRHGSSGGG